MLTIEKEKLSNNEQTVRGFVVNHNREIHLALAEIKVRTPKSIFSRRDFMNRTDMVLYRSLKNLLVQPEEVSQDDKDNIVINKSYFLRNPYSWGMINKLFRYLHVAGRR